ncbi:MAG: glycosyltransferase family 2 protein [Gammaproteobacteria bacterium]
MTGKVHIVLATHNGAAWLPAQLDSLLGQSERSWTLLISDDGSGDETPDIINRFAERDARIHVLESRPGMAGSALTMYAGLLAAAFDDGADYVFCCDQDDVWAADKIERVLAALRRLEGPEREPALVHHDLTVVDERLEGTAESYWRLLDLHPGPEERPQRLLSRNEVTGCALACNRALLEAALPVPKQAVMHDWWLALHAGFLGRLRPMPERFVSYRQHGANVIGAKSYRAGLNPLQNWRRTWRRGNEEFFDTVRQARAFRAAVAGGEPLAAELQRSLESYARLPELSAGARLAALREAGVWRGNALLDGVLVLRMLLLPAEGER